jgi:hypothetical protein
MKTETPDTQTEKPSIRVFLKNELIGMQARTAFCNLFTEEEIEKELDAESFTLNSSPSLGNVQSVPIPFPLISRPAAQPCHLRLSRHITVALD